MPPVTSLPTWAVYCVAFGGPPLAFLGAFLGHVLARRTAVELEVRSQREETMRTLRWAADLAVRGDDAAAAVALRILEALGESDLLQPDQQTLIDATLAAILNRSKRRILGTTMSPWSCGRETNEMSEQLVITPRQAAAARLVVKRSAVTGQPVSRAVKAAAQAIPVPLSPRPTPAP